MRPKTCSIGRLASSRMPWIAAAALSFLVGTACTDQPEAADQSVSPPAAAELGARANLPLRQERARIPFREQARTPLEAPAELTARAGAQDPERRQQRVARLKEDRYAKLGLSDEQTQSIEALRAEQQTWRDEHRDEVRALSKKRKAARQAGDEAEAEAIRARDAAHRAGHRRRAYRRTARTAAQEPPDQPDGAPPTAPGTRRPGRRRRARAVVAASQREGQARWR